MSTITIPQYESGTIIPQCALDKPTDTFRRYFGIDLDTFERSFKHARSPARWLYFLLSNQQHLTAKTTHLANNIERCQQALEQQRLTLSEQTTDTSALGREETRVKQQALNTLEQSLERLSMRLETPIAQLKRLKALRAQKITAFGTLYPALAQQLKQALVKGGMTQYPPETPGAIIAFVFGLKDYERMKTDDSAVNTVYPKIIEAIVPLTPPKRLESLKSLLTQPNLWSLLACNPNLPMATALTPILLEMLDQFDTFRNDHAILIQGMEKLKTGLAALETYYAKAVINSPVSAMQEAAVINLYNQTQQPSQAPRDATEKKAPKKKRFGRR